MTCNLKASTYILIQSRYQSLFIDNALIWPTGAFPFIAMPLATLDDAHCPKWHLHLI
ncbi:hypothetical protein FVEG_00474 [Fusarium verticillioides 7600]|uniref:Uncharacterized protein n=1 Tax=Gibberella moniliformis (strain M3125 / FGSC 7600) TaxID=334819 RepID=W7LLR8_GIBM7|nr:hypothetical protein FVEG_00474 [Fusarium verticillioides 7600]EWG36440.1 hypothetical protein FVEG_00474 [Fusarium verticillioides 7600]